MQPIRSDVQTSSITNSLNSLASSIREDFLRLLAWGRIDEAQRTAGNLLTFVAGRHIQAEPFDVAALYFTYPVLATPERTYLLDTLRLINAELNEDEVIVRGPCKGDEAGLLEVAS